jgi:hypothetical protein
MDEVSGRWRKLHNDQLRDLYSLPSIIRMIRSRRIRLGRACSTNGEKRKAYYWYESQRERDYWEDQDVGGWIIRER